MPGFLLVTARWKGTLCQQTIKFRFYAPRLPAAPWVHIQAGVRTVCMRMRSIHIPQISHPVPRHDSASQPAYQINPFKTAIHNAHLTMCTIIHITMPKQSHYPRPMQRGPIFLGMFFFSLYFFWYVFCVFPRKTACSLHFGWIPCHFLRFP